MQDTFLQKLFLQTLFEHLRQPLALSTDNYLTALKALKSGFGLENFEDFKHLCCVVWAKSQREIQIIEEFLQVYQHFHIDVTAEEPEDESLSITEENEATYNNLQDEQENPAADSAGKQRKIRGDDLERPPLESEDEESEPVKIVQAIRQSLEKLRSDENMGGNRSCLDSEYFPATQIQMTKSWLRMQVREVKRTVENIDINATLQEIGHLGFLLEPKFSLSSHRVDLIFLMDWKGSMVPFHNLCEQLVETAEKGGQFRGVQKYYFYNCPDLFLFNGPSRINATAVANFMSSLSNRTMVLVVSDAGAARGKLNLPRTEKTQRFIYQLEQTNSRFAWLNPMPVQRWEGNSAEKINKIVPMFSMSRYALDEIARLVQQTNK